MDNIAEVNICQTKKKIPPRKPPRLSIGSKPGNNPTGEKERRNSKEGVASGLDNKDGLQNKGDSPHPSRVEMTGSQRDYDEVACTIGGEKRLELKAGNIKEKTWREHVYESISDHITTRSTSSQTEVCSVEFEDYFSKPGGFKVFKETSCQTDDSLDSSAFKRTKKGNSEDEAMVALGKTKESRLSSASSNSMRDSVDSGHFSVRVCNPEQSPTSQDHCGDSDAQYLWQPEGLSQEEVTSFMDSLPPGKIPKTGTPEGVSYFKTQLVYQNPEQDADPALCKSLTTKDQSIALKNVWLDCVKSRGTGYIQLAESSNNACECCDELFKEKEVTVVARDGLRHPSCFSCTVCHELLVKLIYYDDGNNRLFCGRHFAELFRPRCFDCDELVISGKIIKAMGHAWHAEHFCCVKCGEKIAENKYTSTDQERPMCLGCHTKHLADQCQGCGKKIVIGQKKMSHEGQHWHDECFACEKCQDLLSLGRFSVKDDKIMCFKCCQSGKSKLCYRCGNEIKPGSELFEHNKNYYHGACFSCEFCNQRINSGFMEHDEWFYCPECYHRLFSEKCAQCSLPVSGDGITYNDEVWHSSCFDCFYCHESISSQSFLVRFGNRYCNGCHEKMFAKECHSCHEMIKDAAYLTTNDMFWHNQCFRCANCEKDLKSIGFHMVEQKIYCSDCPVDIYTDVNETSSPTILA